ncbi:hypothetical protein PHYBOEH_002934 [Phytophthora boehmeriae]|uniref:Uncharacterized protein n=1 Tax=Phytophthora boehmeriae TaxID=109152 RepID=A0A8T1WS04_9STRA|nr:hypothetical protein PHYBOEH_002934 [Phytophthora boehmeriae]
MRLKQGHALVQIPSLQPHTGLGEVPAIAIAAFRSVGNVAGADVGAELVVIGSGGFCLAEEALGAAGAALGGVVTGAEERKGFCVRFSMAWMAWAISRRLWSWFLQPTHWQRVSQRPLAAKHSQ